MNVWVAVMATVAIMCLVVIPVLGILLFRPERARNVKIAERASSQLVQQHVIELALHHPDMIKRPRFDRHPFYVAPHVGVLAYAICIFFGARPTNNVAAMSELTRLTMAVCFFVGSALVIAGSSMGVKIGRWTILPKVRDHPCAPLLGDDVALPYWIEVAGLLCVTVSMSIYSSTSFQTTTGSLGGWLTATLAGASAAGIVRLGLLAREYSRNETLLIAEVWARLGRESDDVD